VREAQERKSLRFPFTTLLPILRGEPPKLDQSRFSGWTVDPSGAPSSSDVFDGNDSGISGTPH
jgi:hypothetical protein